MVAAFFPDRPAGQPPAARLGHSFGAIEDLRDMLVGMAAGGIRPAIDWAFAMDQVPDAFAHMAAGGPHARRAWRDCAAFIGGRLGHRRHCALKNAVSVPLGIFKETSE